MECVNKVPWHVLIHIISPSSNFDPDGSDQFKVAHIEERVLPLHDLTMFNSAASSVQHQITLW
jgi:hypothetical protein